MDSLHLDNLIQNWKGTKAEVKAVKCPWPRQRTPNCSWCCAASVWTCVNVVVAWHSSGDARANWVWMGERDKKKCFNGDLSSKVLYKCTTLWISVNKEELSTFILWSCSYGKYLKKNMYLHTQQSNISIYLELCPSDQCKSASVCLHQLLSEISGYLATKSSVVFTSYSIFSFHHLMLAVKRC